MSWDSRLSSVASSRSEEQPEGQGVRGVQQGPQEGRSVSFNCSPGGAPTTAPGVVLAAAPGAALAAAPGEAAGAFGVVAAFSGSVAGKDPAHQVL